MKKVIVYTDGSSIKADHGGFHGGAGAVLIFGDKKKTISQPIPFGTNNISELTAPILALKSLKEPCEVDLYTDSQYTIKCLTEWLEGFKRRNWKTQNKGEVKNKELIQRLEQLCKIHKVNWHWVKGHDGDKYNTLADELACEASQLLRDEENK